MRQVLMAAGLALSLVPAGLAQESAPLAAFEAALRDATMPLAAGPESLSGPGGEFLLARGRAAELVMIGEQHATAGIAEFSATLHAGIADAGHGAFVVEVGPWSAAEAERLLEAGPEVFETEAAGEAGGLAYPFLFFREEAALARQAVTAPGAARTALWGVDQEFVASGTIHARWFAGRARTPAQVAAATAFAEAASANPMLVGAAPAAEIEALAAAFAGDAEAEARAEGLLATNRIYAPFTGRGGSVLAANTERENLMRHYFLDHVARAEAEGDMPERLFFKFGGNHAMRGLTPTHVMGFGGFVEEWGRTRGLSYFSLFVECQGGEMRDPQSGGTAPCASYFGEAGSVLSAAEHDGPVVIDLAALRPAAAQARAEIGERVYDVVFGFDALVILPDVAPATPLAVH